MYKSIQNFTSLVISKKTKPLEVEQNFEAANLRFRGSCLVNCMVLATPSVCEKRNEKRFAALTKREELMRKTINNY